MQSSFFVSPYLTYHLTYSLELLIGELVALCVVADSAGENAVVFCIVLGTVFSIHFQNASPCLASIEWTPYFEEIRFLDLAVVADSTIKFV